MGEQTERKENESYARFMRRVVAMAADKRISYTEMGDALLGEGNVYSEDNLRKSFYVLSKVCDKFEEETDFDGEDILNEIKEQKRLLEEAKVRFRDERMAYNAQNRNAARLEQRLEYLESALSAVGGERFQPCVMPNVNSDNDLLVVLSDLHIGAAFNSSFGEFNSDIAKRRLNDYLNEILKIGKRHNSQNVYIIVAGDVINGNIHKTIQVTNRENVIDQVKLAVDCISAFCFELTQNFANVYFSDCAGNHSRIDRKEDALHDERLDSLIAWTISKLLSHVGNFKTVLDGKLDTGIAKLNIRGKEYVAVHGDYDEASKKSMAQFTMMIKSIPYAVVMGHRHYPAVTDECGVRVVQGGSLCGSGDDYTIEKRLIGKPSQTVCVCSDKGIECVYPVVFD